MQITSAANGCGLDDFPGVVHARWVEGQAVKDGAIHLTFETGLSLVLPGDHPDRWMSTLDALAIDVEELRWYLGLEPVHPNHALPLPALLVKLGAFVSPILPAQQTPIDAVSNRFPSAALG